jgi:hypothetical protein
VAVPTIPIGDVAVGSATAGDGEVASSPESRSTALKRASSVRGTRNSGGDDIEFASNPEK